MPSKSELEDSTRKGPRCPYIATDIIIEYSHRGKNGIVLIERKNSPHGLALPGGFAEYGLALEENAAKEAKEETNLDVKILVENHPFMVLSQPDRDPRAHVISSVYIGQGVGTLKGGDDAKEARFYTLPEIWEMIPKNVWAFKDHAHILRSFIMDEAIYRSNKYPEMEWMKYGK